MIIDGVEHIEFLRGIDILPEFDLAVITGTGASFKHYKSNFSFTIHPRKIPAPTLPKPKKAPLWKDVKDHADHGYWKFQRDLSKQEMNKYLQSKRLNGFENKIMVKLQKIRSMLEKL